MEVTEIVVEDPEVEVCNLAGKGFPGAFFPIPFLASEGFTIFGERFAIFFATGFFTALFFGIFFATGFFTFLADDFTVFFPDFLNNFFIATLLP